jgi:hypothetical protein
MSIVSTKTPTISLFSPDSWADIPWPDTPDGAYARAYLASMLQHGTQHFVENANTKLRLMLIDEQIVLPLTINAAEYENSYVCSPYTHYVTYAQEELDVLKQPLLERLLAGVIALFGLFCKASRINRVVCVNNWLLSTNLYPQLTAEQIQTIITFLKKRFPRHAIIFRSLNMRCYGTILKTCQQEKCKLIPSRQVYLVRPGEPQTLPQKARWQLRRDKALFAKHGYTIIEANEMGDIDISRIVELYNMLYLDKYSRCNPMLNYNFIKLALNSGILSMLGLKKDGRIDAVLGYFCRDGVMTTPLFGYDTNIPQSVGLYRMLTVALFQEAAKMGQLLNCSSGAANFKRVRGCVGEIEYSAVYDQHLPWYCRVVWSLLSSLLQGIGVPLLKKYKF